MMTIFSDLPKTIILSIFIATELNLIFDRFDLLSYISTKVTIVKWIVFLSLSFLLSLFIIGLFIVPMLFIFLINTNVKSLTPLDIWNSYDKNRII